MSERANGASGKTKKSKVASSNAANSTKASTRAPPRMTTVQKLHVRLQQAGCGSARRVRTDVSGETASAPAAGSGAGSEANSRDSSPGIDGVLPPSEPAPTTPPPPPPRKQDVKRTAAQIFRELARCKAEQEAEVQRISALEFVATPEEAVNKKAIELEEQEAIDRAERRMLALLSLENSIVAKEKALEEKKKLGDKALDEKRSLQQTLAELRKQEQLIADQVRDAVRSMRERSRQAMTEAAEQRAAEARQFGEETLSMVREAQKQKEEERQHRALLIQQIRQLEALPLPRFRELDLTETAGHGLLDEMSIVELRERLALLKMERSTELKEKNQRILNEKRMQEEQMEMAEKVLARFHEIQALERRQRQEQAGRPPVAVTSARLEQLQQELEQKRAARQRRDARRRAARRPDPFATVAPPPAAARSAPADVGRRPASGRHPAPAAEAGRRSFSDSAVQLTEQARRLSAGRAAAADGAELTQPDDAKG